MSASAIASKRRAAIGFIVGGVVLLAIVIAILLLTRVPPKAAAKESTGTSYDLGYTVAFLPAEGAADVMIETTPGSGSLRQLQMRMPADRYSAIDGDGEIVRDGDTVTWTPVRGRQQHLRYRYRIDDRRGDGGYDALITPKWVIVRGDDLVPPATVRSTRGADSRARLGFVLPEGWTSADTPYERSRDGGAFVVADPGRNFDRPTGWILAGDIGVRREYIRSTQISVAGPVGHDLRRLDTLAFLNLLVPEFRDAFGKLPPKLLVVTAGEPMWRGGLSGPRSLFVHADRPLVSENGTSTLVHEMAHVVTGIRGADGDDWLAEGLAEYYSIELPRRAGLLSDDRAGDALDWMAGYGAKVTTLTADRSSGTRTARAVQLLAELDRELRAGSDGERTLDDVARILMKQGEVSRDDLRTAAREVAGADPKVLATPLLDD